MNSGQPPEKNKTQIFEFHCQNASDSVVFFPKNCLHKPQGHIASAPLQHQPIYVRRRAQVSHIVASLNFVFTYCSAFGAFGFLDKLQVG